MNYVYILRCRDNTLYCGWTNNLSSRIHSHNSGKRSTMGDRGRFSVSLSPFSAPGKNDQVILVTKLPCFPVSRIYFNGKCTVCCIFLVTY